MKVNCKALKISIWISSISLVFSIIFKILYLNTNNNILEFLHDIVLGIFCSTIITVFFYTSAYKVEKRKLLENYWNDIRKILMELYKVEYMQIDYNKEIIIGYIRESSNLWIKEYNKINPNNKIEEDLTNTNLLKEIIIRENKNFIDKLSEDNKEEFLNNRLERLYKKTINKMDKIIDQYLNFLTFSIESLNLMLGDMCFFYQFDNYKKAYNLFKNIYDLRIKIQKSAVDFRYYKEGEGNRAFVLSEILNLQKNIFRVEEREDVKLIYNEFNDEMNNKLEEFRANIIYKINPEYYEKFPIMQIPQKKVEN